MEKYKPCSKCKQIKPFSSFSSHKGNKFGLQSRCKDCCSVDRKLARQQNYELSLEREAKARIRNRDKRLISNAAYRARNQERERERKRRYAKDNPEKIRLADSRRRTRLKQAQVYKISDKDLRHLENAPCFYCGKKAEHFDHVIPIARGGSHGIGNLVAACSFCNISKNDKFIMEWKISKSKINKKKGL